MSAFDTAWNLLKEGEPVVEFDDNDKCPIAEANGLKSKEGV